MRGRKSIYDEVAFPHLEHIKNAVAAGATDAEIAKSLGINVSTLCEWKNKHPEFKEAFSRGRKEVVIEIKAALLKKALGFEYEEERKSGKKDKNGENIVYIEKYKRYCPPSETAARMLLNNYDSEWIDTDNATSRLKRQEMELKTAIAKSNNFDIDI